jgi:hypothetical protein
MKKTLLLLMILFLAFTKTSVSQSKNHKDDYDQRIYGHFYKTLQDYKDNKHIRGIEIQFGSYEWLMIVGTKFKIKDTAGYIRKVNAKDLPSDLFTYSNNEDDDPFLLRVMDKDPYIVLAAGELNFYSLFQAQNELYFSEGWSGELKKFKEKVFKEYLEKFGLLESYKKDKPKRQFRDSGNSYFNKIVIWQTHYFNLLNEKMHS